MILREQALAIVELWPQIARLLFRLDINDPTSELPVAQMKVCSLLRDGARSMSSISAELGISVSAVTQLTDRLVHAGMVERLTEGEDRRVKILQLTAHAKESMDARRERRADYVQQALMLLTPEESTKIVEMLDHLLQAGQALLPDLTEERANDELEI
jgi:DNA-binding MarR family transcriptional regulator